MKNVCKYQKELYIYISITTKKLSIMSNINTPHEIRRFYFGKKLYLLEHSTWCNQFTLGIMGQSARKGISRAMAAHILGRRFSHFASQ